MKFVKKHPFLIVYVIALIVCLILKVRGLWILLGSLVYLLAVMLIRLPNTAATLGYFTQTTLKNPERAMKLYDWAFSHGATSTVPRIAYGMQLIVHSRYEEALKVLQDVLVTPGLSPMYLKVVRRDLAIAYEKTGDVKTAISTMEQMEKDYDILDADFYSTLSYFYIQDGDLKKAKEANEKALKEDASCPGAFDNMAQMEYVQGHLDEAKDLYEKALELKSSMVSSNYYLGRIYEQQGDLESARNYYTAAHNCTITGLHTVTREQVDEKYNEFLNQ